MTADEASTLEARDGVITVGVFSFNQGPYVDECIDSMLGEADVRFVLIDDGSQDESPERVRGAADRLRRVGHDVDLVIDGCNRGLASRVNAFLAGVRSEYFCLVNADDRFLRGGLSVLRSAGRQHQSASVVFSAYGRVDPEGNPLPGAAKLGRMLALRRAYSDAPRAAFDDLLVHGNFVPGGCTLVRTAVVHRVGAQFDPALTIAEDHDFWLQLGPDCRYLFVDTPTWDYRILKTSKFHSAGADGLRSELVVLGRHGSRASSRIRLLSTVQAAHRAKRHLLQPQADGISFSEAARLLRTSRWTLAGATFVAGVQSAWWALGRRIDPGQNSG